MLVTGARRPAAAPPCADKAEHRMVVRKRRNARGPLPTRAGLNGSGWNEPTSIPTNTWQVAPLNESPHR
jgi:hypothetical protein